MTRVLGALLSACLAATAQASREGSVYTFDKTAPLSISSNHIPTLSPGNARLLLAQRLGLSQYHSLQDADDMTIRLLNEHSGSQTQLFREDGEARRLMVVIEGVKQPEDVLDRAHTPAFRIDNLPSMSANIQLVTDLLDQDRQRRKAHEGCTERASSDKRKFVGITGGYSSDEPFGTCLLGVAETEEAAEFTTSQFLILQASQEDLPRAHLADSTSIYHMSSLQFFAEGFHTTDTDHGSYVQAAASLKQVLQRIISDQNQDLTILLLPPSTTKLSTNSWGYSPLTRRQQEAPIVAVPASSKSSAKTHPSQPQVLATSSVPSTLLPSCQPSKENCQTATNNCTGHGECLLSFAYKKSDIDAECWACACKATVVDAKGDGKKTTVWAGPACQKKDVSVPFFLFAGFTVMAVATVAWAIGLLYSVGESDLPSVLGAGVPPSRK